MRYFYYFENTVFVIQAGSKFAIHLALRLGLQENFRISAVCMRRDSVQSLYLLIELLSPLFCPDALLFFFYFFVFLSLQTQRIPAWQALQRYPPPFSSKDLLGSTGPALPFFPAFFCGPHLFHLSVATGGLALLLFVGVQ